MSTPMLETRGIRKAFPGTQALQDVSFQVLPGEVHALVGENGAGKSTLMHILSGVLQPDSGETLIQGVRTKIHHPKEAQDLGIGTVFQELSLIPNLSVAENVFPNRAPTRNIGLVNWGALYNRTQDLLEPFQVDINPKTLVRHLNVSNKQIVEIAKALSLEAKILLLDEPTAALSPDEVHILFKLIRHLKENGLAIVFISHRVQEIFEIADRVTILRDGERVGTYAISELSPDQMVQLMVGRALQDLEVQKARQDFKEILRVEELSGEKAFQEVSFTLRKGEILGLAGLKGAGRPEVARAIVGADQPSAGKIFVEGKQVSIHSPADALRYGIGYLPEERKLQGLFLQLAVSHNIVVANLKRFSRYGLMDAQREKATARGYVEQLDIRTPSVEQLVGRLSGGNQQKVMLAKWLLTNPKILIVDEPTHGIDVGAKIEIHALLSDLSSQGVGILLISSELPEILSLADRIVVMHEGRITGELPASEASEEKIIALASGHVSQLQEDLNRMEA
jgi:ribose transport system ATP-binding protein